MTLIIGHKCSDGVVLAADRKLLRGEEPHYGDKIFELGGVVFAFEGLTGIRDDFLLLLRSELSRGASSLYEVKLVVEDIVEQLWRRYEQRLGGGAYLGALMAGLENIHTGNAELYYVHPQGYGEAVPYRCSGHGADYAHALAKFLLLPELSVEESAFRAAFIIWWVEDLDTTVGGPPQVAMIRNRPSVPLSGQAVATVEYLSPESVERARKLANRKKRAFPGLMFR